MIVVEVVFWAALLWLAYVFVLYPLGMAAAARLRPRPVRPTPGELPRVAFIMAAYNEERVIAERVRNYLEIDYPRELLEFHIGSDGSTDGTDEIIREFCELDPSIHLYRYNRVGKTQIIYELGETVEADVIVFTDADVLLDRSMLKTVVPLFGDETVGGVVGKVEYSDRRKTAGSSGERKFIAMESSLRASEAAVWTTVAPTGQCFVVRRGAYTPLRDYKLSDDLNLAITIGLNGYRVWYEPAMVIHETNRRSLASEWTRRLRMGQQATATYLAFRETRLPWRSWVGFEVWSHKLLRNLAAIPLSILAAASVALAFQSDLYAIVAALSAFGVLWILAGALAERLGINFPILLYPLYFSAMITALTVGSIRAYSAGGLEMWSSPRLE